MSRPKKAKSVEMLKGINDILPEDQKYWRLVFKKAEALLDYYGFEKIDLALLEPSDLFYRALGDNPDAEKRFFSFKTKAGESFGVKFDNRISVARAYINNGMSVKPHPVKLYYISPVFRNEEVEPGRLRQVYQLGAETIGDNSEIIDAELIFIAYKLLDNLGLYGYNVHINSIGDNSCRSAYIRALKDFYKNKIKRLCSVCKNNLKEDPLKVLSCKNESCLEINKEIPQSVDFLDEECRLHFKHVIEFLDEVSIPYILNPFLMKDRNYYSRTIFEFLPEEDGAYKSPIISGGRYDRLIDSLGGAKTPAAGWSMGLDRVVAILKEKNISVPESKSKPKVFLIQLGELAKRKSLALFESFRKAGIEAKSSLGRDSMKSQLRIANRLAVRFALIFGQKEALDNTVILREMDTGIQETLPIEKILDEIKKRLKA